MASPTEICNQALGHLQVSKEIANLETERSAEAAACRRFYETARDAVLRAFHWPFATKIKALALIEEDPNDEWGYSYTYPTDCLKARKILSGTRNDSRDTRIPYRLAYGDSGTVILTDQDEAELEYTVKVTDTNRFPHDFNLLLSLRLASLIAPTVTGGDPYKLGEHALDRYRMEFYISMGVSLNEEQQEEDPESEFIRGRD